MGLVELDVDVRKPAVNRDSPMPPRPDKRSSSGRGAGADAQARPSHSRTANGTAPTVELPAMKRDGRHDRHRLVDQPGLDEQREFEV